MQKHLSQNQLHSILENDAYFRVTQEHLTLGSHLKRILTGIVIPQEYCCLELERLDSPLKVVITVKNNSYSEDITTSHLFLGYKPLIIGLSTTSTEESILSNNDEVCLSFVQGNFKSNSKWRDFPTDSAAVATLILRKIHQRNFEGQWIYLFEGSHAKHRFLGKVYQMVNNLREKFMSRPADHVPLPGNVFDQVRIAYSIPRKIGVITVSDDVLVNMFPTDLQGFIGQGFYAVSLRLGENANAQVETLRRVVISDVDTSSYLHIYSMGKNHMIDLQNERRFMIHHQRTRVFNFPLPEWALRYREMIHVGSFDHGIHRIHFYQIVHSEELENAGPTLAQIQQYYAQWRMDQGLETNLYLRKE